jgi:cysteine desulfurase
MSQPIYMDYMASTPVSQTVHKIMAACWAHEAAFANASALHAMGQAVKKQLDDATAHLAKALGCEAEEIIWTSGATEANNLALRGAAYAYQRQGKHIITLATEHKAVLKPLAQLAREGFEVSTLGVDAKGLLDWDELKQAIRPDTMLISVMQVNNETGVVQPIQALAELAHQHGCLLHVDAAQAPGKTPFHFKDQGADLVSLSGHKCHGPKGIGVLVQSKRVRLQPQMLGAGQQEGRRAGTLPTALILGMAQAVCDAIAAHKQYDAVLRPMRAALWDALKDLPGIVRHSDAQHSVPQVLSVSFEGIDGASLHLALSSAIMTTAGSACHGAVATPSHVLTAMGCDARTAQATLRLGLHVSMSESVLMRAVAHIRKAVLYLHAIAPDHVQQLQEA